MESRASKPTHMRPAQCDSCGGETALLPRSAYVRRGERVATYTAWSWACERCADPFTGATPYRFSDHALGTWNEAQAEAAWRARFGEDLPPSERRATELREVRVPVLLTAREAALLDELRGELSRSEFLRRAIRGA